MTDRQAFDHAIRSCTRCRLAETRHHAVPGEGPEPARWMIIGEAPGRFEDETGRPFVGQSGKRLDAIFAELGLDRRQVFITGSVKCRPPKNRNPRKDELEACREAWLLTQIERVDPELIVLFGLVAVENLLGKVGAMKEIHGRIFDWRERKVIPTYHPAAAMRFPAAREKLQHDLGVVKSMLG